MDRALRVDYDAEGDILYVFFGPPRPSIATPVGDGIEVFFADDGTDNDSDEIVSIMIDAVSHRTGVGRAILRVPVDVTVSKSADFKSTGISLEEQYEQVQRENPELIAKCEAMAAERVRTVAESRGEYRVKDPGSTSDGSNSPETL